MKKNIQYINKSFLSPKDAWDTLSLEEKSNIIRAGIESGIIKLGDIRKAYNEYAQGGEKESEEVDSVFMASKPNPLDIAAKAALNYSSKKFGHIFPKLNTSVRKPAPLNLAELKQRQRFMETGFNDNLISSVGAKGRYQVTDSTLDEYTKKTGETGDLFDPVFNEKVRDWYMNENLEGRNWITKGEPSDSIKYAKKLAAYNYGPTNTVNALNRAKAAGKDIYTSWEWLEFLPQETRNYINFIERNQDVTKHKNNAEYNKAIEKMNKKSYGGLLVGNLYQLG